jgi:hypothetical protein
MSDNRSCPHCQSTLKRWKVPDGATWTEEYFLVCFDDDCPHYVEGWTWMKEQYAQNASYRYALNPTTGSPFSIPVWSASATREMIMDDEEGDAS